MNKMSVITQSSRLRLGVGFCLLTLGTLSSAQLPDARFKADLTMSIVTTRSESQQINFYSPFGRYSTFGLQVRLEPGIQAFISQRLQRIRNDVDNDVFDEYYVEDQGFWRIGKQYLPFGNGTLLRESVLAARADNDLILEGIPVAFAIFDNGSLRQRGTMLRLGGKSLGFSAALGTHLGINGTALATVRSIEDSPGIGEGWRQAFGIDWNRRVGKLSLRFEAIALRSPHTSLFRNQEVVDGSLAFDFDREWQVSGGLSRILGTPDTIYRMGVTRKLGQGVTIETLFRMTNNRVLDLNIVARVRF